ncbi:hypothetical protein [Klebsiella pneumoniae]|uniref:hypothetical protein n=1 Tax=Klebsiella pneumoniae TaxID=573 RepID=UPI0023E3742C|nr:hypothetical protein [Klebsiella pneumoniae]
MYGGAGDADSDGVIPIKITLNSPTDTVQLLFSRQITPERGTQHIHGFCSIKAAAFAGALNVSAIARTIASVTRTVTAAPGPVTETENLYGGKPEYFSGHSDFAGKPHNFHHQR